MKLVRFEYTNEYDKQNFVYVNAAFVVTLRPIKSNQTTISLASKAEITVDGSLDDVAYKLSSDYDPAQIKETG